MTDFIEIILVSADEMLSRSFNPIEFQNTFRCDWKTEELIVPIKSVSIPEQLPQHRTYRRAPDQIKHRRSFNYDGLETWMSIRVVTFKEAITA